MTYLPAGSKQEPGLLFHGGKNNSLADRGRHNHLNLVS